MADTSFGTNDPRTQTKWSRAVFVYALQNICLTPLMGKSKSSLIRVLTELDNDKRGDTIVVESPDPLSGAGQGDDGDTTGNEESLRRRNMSLVIHERAHSVVSAGKMSEKRTSTNIREDAKDDLGSWLSEALENDLITSMAGLYNENSSSAAIETINEAYPSSARIHYGGQNAAGTLATGAGAVVGASFTTDALLTADTTINNLMGTVLLSATKRRALSVSPRFLPVAIRDLSKANPDDVRKGVTSGPLIGKFFLVLLHPYHIKAVRAETGATGWAQMTAAAQVRGNMNPIFSGASFLWDSMVVWEYDRIPIRTGAGSTTLAEGFLLNATRTATTDACANGRSVARALLLGAGAACFGWGQHPKWYEDKIDARKPKVVVDMLYGIKRTAYNAHGTSTVGQDEAIYCIDTEVVVDA